MSVFLFICLFFLLPLLLLTLSIFTHTSAIVLVLLWFFFMCALYTTSRNRNHRFTIQWKTHQRYVVLYFFVEDYNRLYSCYLCCCFHYFSFTLKSNSIFAFQKKYYIIFVHSFCILHIKIVLCITFASYHTYTQMHAHTHTNTHIDSLLILD